MTLVAPEGVRDAFFRSRKWEKRICSSCKRIFFAKEANKTNRCERGPCAKDSLAFLDYPRKRSVKSFGEIQQKLVSSLPYSRMPADHVDSVCGQTDLIGAGVQKFEEWFLKGEEPIPQDFLRGALLLQPVIRMKHFGSADSVPGSSTAFVNICTLALSIKYEQMLSTLDHWLDALSGLGIHMSSVTIMSRTSEEDWGAGQFTQHELFVMYGGLELGDASFALQPSGQGTSVTVSDIGFGLERIVWAVQRYPNYFDALRPLSLGVEYTLNVHDAIRTLALMFCASNIRPASRSAGGHMRRLCKEVHLAHVDEHKLQALLEHYMQYWAEFMGSKPAKQANQAQSILNAEFLRLTAREFEKVLGVPSIKLGGSICTTEDYLRELVYTHGIPHRTVRAMFWKNRE